MGVTQYIGARYVPLFADPIEWDNTQEYEPLTVVMNNGSSYVSRQWVPVGIDIENTDYWLLWADYNAQIAQYRAEVQAYDGRISTLEDELPSSDFSSSATVKDAIDAVSTSVDSLGSILPSSDFSSSATVKDAIDAVSNSVAALGAILPTSDFSSSDTVKAAIDSKQDTVTIYGHEDLKPGTKPYFFDGDAVNLGDVGQRRIITVEDGTLKSAMAAMGWNTLAQGQMDVCESMTYINSYLEHKNDFTYSVFYTASRYEGTYAAPTPVDPKQHLINGKKPIDCATFCQLIGHGTLYGNSLYSGGSTLNIMSHPMFNPISESVKPYWYFQEGTFPGEDTPMGSGGTTGLLTSAWARMLFDAGQLEWVGGLAQRIVPGYIYFSGSVADRFLNIGHCYAIAGLVAPGNEGTIIAHSTNVGGMPGIFTDSLEHSGLVGTTKARYLPPWTTGSSFKMQMAASDTRRNWIVEHANMDLNNGGDGVNFTQPSTYIGAYVVSICPTTDALFNLYVSCSVDNTPDASNPPIADRNIRIRGPIVLFVPFGATLNVRATSSTGRFNVIEQICTTDKLLRIPSRGSI